jgi:hypothetical protein
VAKDSGSGFGRHAFRWQFYQHELAPRGSLAPGNNLTHWSEHSPLSSPQRVNTLCPLEEWRGAQTPGANFCCRLMWYLHPTLKYLYPTYLCNFFPKNFRQKSI